MAFVMVQHLDPAHESALTQILSRATGMPVREVTNKLRVEPNRVYVIPPNVCMHIKGGVLLLKARKDDDHQTHRAIDIFLESLADDQHERAIGVILSGTASDGTQGLEAIKAEGGITFAQDETAKYDSMPRTAVSAGCVDYVLSPEQIARELTRIAAHPFIAGQDESKQSELQAEPDRARDKEKGRASPLASGGARGGRTSSRHVHAEAGARRADPAFPEEASFKKALILLRNHCGVDFSLYKSPTIRRRLTRRMVLNQMRTVESYTAFLKGNTKELDALYSDLLISVTSFFRNPEAFEVLKRRVFPEVVKRKGRDEMVRVWTLGCSTGQEAYSIAIAYAEFAKNAENVPRLQVFATDLNDALLDKARRGLYSKALTYDVSPERLRKFFVEEEGGYRVAKPLRDMCVFARHNVLSDPPLSRMDLISCRNLLIYIEPGLQRKILPNFHYALNAKGFLFLGASESIGSFHHLFTPVGKKERIFSKKPDALRVYNLPARGGPTRQPVSAAAKRLGLPGGFRPETHAQHEADRLLANRFAPPGVLVNGDLDILQFRGSVGPYLKLPTGKPTTDLLKLARPELVLPLRVAMGQAKKQGSAVRRENISLESEGQDRTVNIEILPLSHLSENTFVVLFEEALENKGGSAPSSRAPALPIRRALSRKEESDRISELEHELGDTLEYLQSVTDDAQAATEELQASSEELQSANEELQSINEELETSKEELESTNEELTTVNEEMATRNTELSQLNSDLRNLHVSINTAILVLSRDLKVRRSTPLADKLFNLLGTDVDRPLGHINHNLDFPDLEAFVADVIFSMTMREREVQDKAGHWLLLRARPYVTDDNRTDGAVLMFTDIDTLKRTQEAQRLSETRYRRLFETSQDGILVLDPDTGKITEANPFMVRFLGYPLQDLIGKELFEIGLLQNKAASQAAFEEVKSKGVLRYENLPLLTKDGQQRDVEFVCSLYKENEREVIQCNARDISERKAAAESKSFLAAIVESCEDSIISIDFDQIITTWNKGAERLYGYPAREVVGKPLSSLSQPEDLKIIAESIARIRAGALIETLEVERKRANSEHMYVSVTLSLIKSGDEPIGISTISRDITARKRTEILHQRAERLEEIVAERTSQLRETIGELEKFSYSLAHDLRAPLRGMQGFARLLTEGYASKLDVTGLDYLQRIDSAAKRLDHLIQDVLTYTKVLRGTAPLGPIDLQRLVHDILGIHPHWQKPQAEIEVAGPLPVVLGNEAFLTQCFSNLVANAVKFVAPGALPRVRIWSEPEGPGVRLWVEDHGIGIAPGDQQRIFGMFDRIHSAAEYEGTGIGLAIVKKAVERMGGRIGLVSELGRGTKFWIQLKKA